MNTQNVSASSARVDLVLPATWWAVDPDAPADEREEWVRQRIADREHFGDLPRRTRQMLRAECERALRAARTAGAVLCAGGAAFAEDGPYPLVAASLLVAPQAPAARSLVMGRGWSGAGARAGAGTGAGAEAGTGTQAPQGQGGGTTPQEVELPAGRAVRAERISGTPTAAGELAVFEVLYVFVDTKPHWTLWFSTPSLRHASQLAEVFDAIAATVTIPQ